MPDDALKSARPADSRFSELLALGESSLRRLADSARTLQESIGGGPVARGVNPEAAENRAVVDEALTKLKSGIVQMRDLFVEARQTGGVPLRGLSQSILKSGADRAKGIALQAYPPLREAITTGLEKSEAYVKESPYKGLLACLGVGLLLGVIIGR